MDLESDGVWILTLEPARAEGRLREAYEMEAAVFGAPIGLAVLGSLYPDLALERLRLHEVVQQAPSALTPLERGLAAYVTSTRNGATSIASGIRRGLLRLDAPDWLLDNIRAGAALWGVSDDDRIDVIVAYAERLTRAPALIAAADINRLRAVGLTDLDILDLNNVVAYYNYVDRVANGLGLRSALAADDERCPEPGNGSF
jgi:uncharacterized peroxidase-related enzyme